MTNCIIFPNKQGGIDIFYPAPAQQKTLADLAQAAVPDGRPYRIMATSDLPEEKDFRAAWVADFSAPDGYGRGKHDYD